MCQVIEDKERGPRLLKILKGLKKGKRCLVFALYKKEVARLESTLQYQGFDCCSIHGDKSQREREDALSQFRKNITPLMIATDVAARGLDIPGETVHFFTDLADLSHGRQPNPSISFLSQTWRQLSTILFRSQ